jgi:hypothetical protein
LGGERGDGGVVEVGAGGEDAAEKPRGVDAGDFDGGQRLAGVDVVEVVEEAVLVRHGVEVEVEGGLHAGDDVGVGDVGEIAALVGDAEGGEAKAGGGDAGFGGGGIDLAGEIGGCVVEDLAGGGAGLLPEVEGSLLLEGVEEGGVGGGGGEGSYGE